MQSGQGGRRPSLRIGGGVSLSVPAEREGRYAPFAGHDLLLRVRQGHVTNRRTYTHADFADFSVDIEVVEPMGTDAMAFLDIGDTETCSRCRPKSISHTGDSEGFAVGKVWMRPTGGESDMVL